MTSERPTPRPNDLRSGGQEDLRASARPRQSFKRLHYSEEYEVLRPVYSPFACDEPCSAKKHLIF